MATSRDGWEAVPKGIVDLHTHTFRSDGELCPAELAQRARLNGYSVLGLADHADHSNLEAVLDSAVKAAKSLRGAYPGFRVVPGVEITHVPPPLIPGLIRRARELGALCVVVHGESPVEPVEPGTNLAAISGRCDILAHPGPIGEREALLAAKNGVALELSARGGHSLANGAVAKAALATGCPMVISSDAHAPGDILSPALWRMVARGAGLGVADARKLAAFAARLAKRLSASSAVPRERGGIP
ncbi:MAG: histidinol phosphate phosphatase domain-containing protein [Deltaproteobacteria bacterium]|jgi:histidinol phosphatase-like PHP family hydrolase|nr:histidinol phosphate phosphatase domain-containing protein [Deltaproteobacteria bacterium]